MKEESLDPKRQLLIAALYGELDEETLGQFQALIDEDPVLRAEWEELRETRALLETAVEPAATPEFVFLEPARAAATPRRFWGLPAFSAAWGFASVAACLAILMGAGLRMDRVDNGLILRFGPAPAPKPAATVPAVDKPRETAPPFTTPLPVDGVRGEATSQTGPPVTRDDLNRYSTRMLDAMTHLVDESQDRQRREFAYMMGRFYEEMTDEQQRKYESLRQRVDIVGLGLMSEQTRTNQQISRLTDQVRGTDSDSLATPRNPDKDK
jgi:hypothetical protein